MHKPIRKKRFPQRSYELNGYGELFQMDIGVLFSSKYNGKTFSGFLLIIDCFSNKIFLEALTSKDAKTTLEAIKKIFNRSTIPNKIECDSGGEFKNKYFSKYCQDNNIFVKYKVNLSKASFAEQGVGLTKRILFKMMRSYRDDVWPKFLNNVEQILNARPLKRSVLIIFFTFALSYI